MSEEIEKHVLEKYEILQKMGRGAYGIVWKSKEKATGRIVALKKVFDAFQNSTDAQRTYREVMYLEQLKNHENIVKLYSVIRAFNDKDLYLVFEIMESDVHVVIRGKLLKDVHKQYIMYQLLKSLKYIHSADLVHRDLKPSNMLINSDCLMKLADFGLARSISEVEGKLPIVSDYIATRWYRAPEILFGSQKYSKSVDVWSSGCIFAEILLEKVLFPGKSSLNQIQLIIELLGKPSETDLHKMNSDLAWTIMQNIKTKKKKSISKIFSSFSPEAVDLLRNLLVFNPDKRYSPNNTDSLLTKPLNILISTSSDQKKPKSLATKCS
jgi:mitogen-activated protein kinase 15